MYEEKKNGGRLIFRLSHTDKLTGFQTGITENKVFATLPAMEKLVPFFYLQRETQLNEFFLKFDKTFIQMRRNKERRRQK